MVNVVNTTSAQELVDALAAEAAHWKGMLAIVLKSQGSSVTVKRIDSDVNMPFDIAIRRLDHEDTKEPHELEIMLLEGKDEIEKIYGKPSPIIVPK